MIVTAMDDGYVRGWSLNGMVRWQTSVNTENGVTDAGFTPKGTEVVFSTASDKGRVGALDARSGRKLWAVDLESSVRAVCVGVIPGGIGDGLSRRTQRCAKWATLR